MSITTTLIIAIATTGISLAGLMIGLVTWLRSDIKAIRGELDGLRKETAELRERMAHLEGLLEGLREAIVSRAAA